MPVGALTRSLSQAAEQRRRDYTADTIDIARDSIKALAEATDLLRDARGRGERPLVPYMLASLLVGVGLGATAMYVLDPRGYGRSTPKARPATTAERPRPVTHREPPRREAAPVRRSPAHNGQFDQPARPLGGSKPQI